MHGERSHPITDADVRSLAAKLQGLHVLLTPAEQAILHHLLRRAAAREEAAGTADVEGFIWGVSFNPFAYLDVVCGPQAEQRVC